MLQRVEGLTDRQAAETVRADLSWKYALGLALDDPGFDASVLSEFRSRVVTHGLEEKALDLLLAKLVEAVYAPFSPAWLRNLPAVQALRVMLIQNYVRVTDRKGREVVKRQRPLEDGGEGLPPGRVRLTSPYDIDPRWAAKGDDLFWNGYKLHISETCHTTADTNGENIVPPNLITNVATTNATVPDIQMTEKIHQMLATRGLPPNEHYLDSGYPSAELLVSARQRFGIVLVTPVLLDHSSRARAAAGYDRSAFTIDWDAEQAICPQGRASSSWSPCTQRDTEAIVVKFSGEVCRPCPVRSLCTSAKKGGRQLTIRARPLQGRARYRGLAKVHLEHVFSAVALNLIRLDAWWNGHPLDRTRTGHLARLELAELALAA
ncbi:transposase [Nonomuraea terrae]|uniref:transposase n=1 Tax=Nonomuraea terrae TaxID=2530383 RepID=UPI0037A05B59